MSEQSTYAPVPDYTVYEEILERARAIARVRIVILWEIDYTTRTAVAVAGRHRQARWIERAMGAAQRLVPGWNFWDHKFHIDATPLARRAVLEATIVEDLATEIIQDDMNPLLLAILLRVGGGGYIRMHPIVVDSRTVAVACFSHRKPLSESQRLAAAGFAREIALTWESRLLQERLRQQEQNLADLHARLTDGGNTGETPTDGQLTYDRVTVDPARRTAFNGASAMQLTILEFDLLAFFLAHPERPITRDELTQHVWKYQAVTSNFVDASIMHLRRKLEGAGAPGRRD